MAAARVREVVMRDVCLADSPCEVRELAATVAERATYREDVPRIWRSQATAAEPDVLARGG